MLFLVRPSVPATSIHQQGFAAKRGASHVKMLSSYHGAHDSSKHEELLMLAAQERLPFEEGNHLGCQVVPISDDIDQGGVE